MATSSGSGAAPSLHTSTQMDKTTRRRLAKIAKKNRLKEEKDKKRAEREKKREEMKAKRRAQRERGETRDGKRGAKGTSEDSCWICGGDDHRKADCPKSEMSTKRCFHCRRRGHTVAECSKKTSDKGDVGICFNCGSEEHGVRDCPKPKEKGGFQFASCFVCGQKGHLSSQCSQSATGIYPKGGKCKICGEVTHLARNCPNRDMEGGNNESETHGSQDRSHEARPARKRQAAPVGGDDFEDNFEVDLDSTEREGDRTNAGRGSNNSKKVRKPAAGPTTTTFEGQTQSKPHCAQRQAAPKVVRF